MARAAARMAPRRRRLARSRRVRHPRPRPTRRPDGRAVAPCAVPYGRADTTGLTSVAEPAGRLDDLAMRAKTARAVGLHPIGQLDDGTPFFAPLGALQVVDDGERVTCHLCGRALQLLSAAHLRRHGWTPQLYRSTFGLN